MRLVKVKGAVALVALLAPTLVGQAATISAAAPVAASAALAGYSPRTGVIFNHPLQSERERDINWHIRTSIDSAPRGSRINIISWNVKSKLYERALINAHNRGVTVRMLMSNGLAEDQGSQGTFERLRRALAQNGGREKGTYSFAKACVSSCRGKWGIAHTKMLTFSKAGKSRYVVMVASANLTEVAAYNQWNDVYTLAGNETVYRQYNRIFAEATRDRVATPPYRLYRSGGIRSEFLPYIGPETDGDPVLDELRRIGCKGAVNAGINGYTSIRIAQTAILNNRGIEIAHRLKRMHNAGCNIRIVYTHLGKQVATILNDPSGRGPVPMRHIVQHLDDDGVVDRYLHMKAMAVSGVYAGNRSARVVWNGTQNWTAKALASDEAGFRIHSGSLERRYGAWVNYLFNNPPEIYPNLRTTGRALPATTYPAEVLH